MRLSTFSAPLSASLLAFAIAFAPLSSQAVTLNVTCDQPNSKLPTINSALKILSAPVAGSPVASIGTNTINVTGACTENVAIDGFERLTLNGLGGATISDASGGKTPVVAVNDSRTVTLNNFTVSGNTGAIAIQCLQSGCFLNGDTVENAAWGVAGFEGTTIGLSGGVLQNNTWGLGVWVGGRAWASGTTIQNNGNGVLLQGGASLRIGPAQPVKIQNNTGQGVTVMTNSSLVCGGGCEITGNGWVGVLIFQGGAASFGGGFGPYSITNNGAAGVLLDDTASAWFDPNGTGTVTGNAGGTDVVCGGPYTTARGATTSIGGGSTNCVEP
jgi:hypothetical protein